MSRAARACLVAVLVTHAVAPRVARADAPQDLSSRSQGTLAARLPDAARADYDEARRLFQSEDFTRALERLERAHGASREPRLLWNMAACERKLGHYARAHALLERYLGEGSDTLTEDEQADGRAMLARLATLTGRLDITVRVPGASIAVDGEARGVSPLAAPLLVDAGSHAVLVMRSGMRDWRGSALVPAAGHTALDVTLVSARARLRVHAPDVASIRVDGELIGVGEASIELLAGAHSLAVDAPDHAPYRAELALEPGETRDVPISLAPVPKFPWAWAGVGALVVTGAAVGAFFAFKPADTRGEPVPGNGGVIVVPGS